MWLDFELQTFTPSCSPYKKEEKHEKIIPTSFQSSPKQISEQCIKNDWYVHNCPKLIPKSIKPNNAKISTQSH